MKGYLLLDVGGTQIKAGVADAEGNIAGDIRSFPSCAREEKEVIFDNFAEIAQKLTERCDTVLGVGMAFPGPFDYERGISLMKGLNKYDSIYGISIEREIKSRCPKLERVPFCYLHDVAAFAVGESWIGKAAGEKRFLCLCIGTGAGSAFVENRQLLTHEKGGVPKDGWIFAFPYKDSIIDDYLSVRGLARISRRVTGKEMEGEELWKLCEKGDSRALRVYREFGTDLTESISLFLKGFQPDAVVFGGQISKSFCYFGEQFQKVCDDIGIRVYLETETSKIAMQGLVMKMKERG